MCIITGYVTHSTHHAVHSPKNLSGTMKVSSGFKRAGYVTPLLFFESW